MSVVNKRFSKLPTFGTTISGRKFFSVTTLISGTLVWFFLVELYYYDIFTDYAVDASMIRIGLLLFYGVGVFSAVIGSSISEKVNRRQLLFLWIILGISVTATLGMFQGEIFAIIFSVLLGISFGVGFPSSAALLADSTVAEERAKVSGVVIFATFALTFLGIIVISILDLGSIGILLFATALRAFSLLGLAFDKCDRKSGKKGSWSDILSYKAFSSYVVPFLLFNAAVGLLTWWTIPQTAEFISVRAIGVPLAYVCIALFGLVAGIAADRFGRRQPIIISFVMLGVSFALLSFYLIPETLLIHYVAYGLAWGFLFTLYLAVPGDLSYPGSKEKFYAIGTMIPLVVYMGLSEAPDLLLIPEISVSLLSPILSIILFLSTIPVFRAAETLPEKLMRKRKIKEHLKEIGKVVLESKENE